MKKKMRVALKKKVLKVKKDSKKKNAPLLKKNIAKELTKAVHALAAVPEQPLQQGILSNIPPQGTPLPMLDEDGSPIGAAPTEGGSEEENMTTVSNDEKITSKNTHEPVEHMLLLDFYIAEMKKEGIPNDFIREKLENAGWPKKTINKFL
jgi:hypothetical protein